MNRREFIVGLGTTALWPLAAHGQQQPLPVVAFMNGGEPSIAAPNAAAFRKTCPAGRTMNPKLIWLTSPRPMFPDRRSDW